VAGEGGEEREGFVHGVARGGSSFVVLSSGERPVQEWPEREARWPATWRSRGSGNMVGAAVERCGEGGDFKIFYFLKIFN
jgi:hypothetical protein